MNYYLKKLMQFQIGTMRKGEMRQKMKRRILMSASKKITVIMTNVVRIMMMMTLPVMLPRRVILLPMLWS